jgi:hypothetical protein
MGGPIFPRYQPTAGPSAGDALSDFGKSLTAQGNQNERLRMLAEQMIFRRQEAVRRQKEADAELARREKEELRQAERDRWAREDRVRNEEAVRKEAEAWAKFKAGPEGGGGRGEHMLYARETLGPNQIKTGTHWVDEMYPEAKTQRYPYTQEEWEEAQRFKKREGLAAGHRPTAGDRAYARKKEESKILIPLLQKRIEEIRNASYDRPIIEKDIMGKPILGPDGKPKLIYIQSENQRRAHIEHYQRMLMKAQAMTEREGKPAAPAAPAAPGQPGDPLGIFGD